MNVNLTGSILIIVSILGVGFYLLKDQSKNIQSELTPYGCGDGTKFVMETVNPHQIKLTSDGNKPLILFYEGASDDRATYGDRKNTLTFIAGRDVAIKTDRAGSYSTACNPLNEASFERGATRFIGENDVAFIEDGYDLKLVSKEKINEESIKMNFSYKLYSYPEENQFTVSVIVDTENGLVSFIDQ